MNLGNKIHTLRKAHGMSQERLAEEIGVSRQAVSKWELNESTPDTEKIISISQLFGVSTDYLLGNEQEVAEDKRIQTNPATESSFGFLSRFVKERGYMAGYVISGYAAALFLMTRLGHYIVRRMILPPEGFGVTYEDLPAEMKWPVQVTNILSIIAAIVFVGGILLALYLRRNRDKR